MVDLHGQDSRLDDQLGRRLEANGIGDVRQLLDVGLSRWNVLAADLLPDDVGDLWRPL